MQARCGDGFLQAGEACDQGDDNADDGECSSDCAWSVCGDGVEQPSEACDDGNLFNNDDCLNSCEFNECGDGYLNRATEYCDDGNDVQTDGCPNDCSSETPCGEAPFPPCASGACGDGVLDPREECDDGNLNDDDGCTSDCHLSVVVDGGVETLDAGSDGGATK